MVSLLAWSASVIDPRFKSRWSQTKDYKIDICCFSAKHTALRRKSKDVVEEAGVPGENH
jgi:hypothetical protein